MRLGDLDALIKALNEAQVEFDEYYKGLGKAKVITDNAPTVEAYTFEQVKELFELSVQMANEIENLKRQTGKWVNHRNDNGHNIADCSLCGKATQWHDEDEDGIPRYCWYCGAEMKGGAE